MFVRQPILAQQAVTPDVLNTLSIPLPNFQDTRYLIPIFSAPYYEASVLPVPGGGLPECLPVTSSGSSSVSATLPARGMLTMYFNQGGGLEFRSAVEEVKARMEEMQGGVAQHMESLPVYEATGSSGGPSSSATSTAASGSSRTIGDTAPPPAESQPDAATFEAASVAVELEEREREAAQRGSIVAQQESLFPDRRGSYSSQQNPPPPSADDSQPQSQQNGMIHPADASLPPAYDEACP